MDYVTANEGKYAGGHVKNTLKAVKSWLSFNDLQLRKKIKIRGADETPTLREERVPTTKELGQIIRSATKQSRVPIILIAHAGLRPETVGDYRGKNGLVMRDFPELRINNREVTFEKVPTRVIVRTELSKSRHQ